MAQIERTLLVLPPHENRKQTLSEGTLSKPVDMGHIWPKCGDDMAQPMGTLWIIHGFGMGYCFPYQTHTWHCLHSVVTLLSYAMGLLRIWQQSIDTP